MKKLFISVIVFCVVPVLMTAAKAKIDSQLSQKLDDYFKEKKFAVLRFGDIPAMPTGKSVLGDNFYSIRVKNGGVFKKSKSLLNLGKEANQTLPEGELVSVKAVEVKKKGVYIAVKTVRKLFAGMKDEGKKSFHLKNKYDNYGTEFEFHFDKEYLLTYSEKNYDFIIKGIENYLKFFETDSEAMAFVSSGGKTTEKAELKTGMTIEEVTEIMGLPEKKLSFGDKTKFVYKDMTVIFESGKVSEVDF